MFCSQCGAQVAEAARFCPACGSNVRGLADAVKASPAAAQRAASTPAPKIPQSTAAPAASLAVPQRVSGARRLSLALVSGALAIALVAGGYLAWSTFGTRLLGSGVESAAKAEGQGNKQATPARDTGEQAEIAAAQAALDREIAKEENEAKERPRRVQTK